MEDDGAEREAEADVWGPGGAFHNSIGAQRNHEPGQKRARTCRTPAEGTAKHPSRGYAKPRPMGAYSATDLSTKISRFFSEAVAEATLNMFQLFCSTLILSDQLQAGLYACHA